MSRMSVGKAMKVPKALAAPHKAQPLICLVGVSPPVLIALRSTLLQAPTEQAFPCWLHVLCALAPQLPKPQISSR